MNFLRVFKKKKIVLALLLVFLLIGSYLYTRNKNSGSNIKSAKIEKGTVREELILSGSIKATEHANLNFLTSGEINYIGVTEGDNVTKGQILAKLDSTNAYQTYLQAEADLRKYQASLNTTYDELQGHKNNESFTQIEARTTAETNKDKAYRNYLIAQNNMSNLSLKAPFDGIITSITHPYNGVNTSLAESQIEIVNPATIYFEVNADQTEVIRLRRGQKVNIVLDSYPEKEIEGEIAYISYTPKVGEVGTVYIVKVMFVNLPTEELKIGMSGDAKFVLSEKNEALYLPPNFINTDTTGKYLNLPDKNKKYIEVGIEGEDKVEIKGDVKEGDVVFD